MSKKSGFKLPMELIEEFAKGNGVIWVGAGSSVGSGLPSWEGLIKSMSQRLLSEGQFSEFDLTYKVDMLDIAQLFKTVVGDHYYYNFLRNEILGRQAKTIHTSENLTLKAVVQLVNHLWPKPGVTVVSTNYDNLLEEELFVKHGKRCRVIVTKEDIATLDYKKDLTVLKPNGDINNPSSIILTFGDYCEFRARKPEFISALADLLSKKTFLFVGYGLADFTFNSIIGELKTTLGPLKRRAYFISTHSSKVRNEVLRSLGIEVILIPSYGEVPFVLQAIAQQQSTVEFVIRDIEKLPDEVKKTISESTILLVDDDEHIIEMMKWIFEHKGWKGFRALSDPEKAMKIIKRQAFDFIIADLMMPKYSGLDVLNVARKTDKNRRSIVAMFTGYGEESPSYSAGADAFFLKPMRIDDIFLQLHVLKRLRDGSY